MTHAPHTDGNQSGGSARQSRPQPPIRRANHGRRPRGRNRRRSAVVITLAIIAPQLVLAAVLAVRVGALPVRSFGARASAQPTVKEPPLRVGECVRRGDPAGDVYARVGCTDFRAYGQVIDLVNGASANTEACAEATDFFATRPDGVVCLRRTGTDHPGDPGRGGGVYRAGDCVAADAETGVRETPCNSPSVFQTVTARVRTVAECRPPAVRFATLESGTARVLCLGDGPGIAGPGDCVANPKHDPVTFAAVPCTGSKAGARVLARVATPEACQLIPGQTHYVEDPSGLPASRVVCLAVIR